MSYILVMDRSNLKKVMKKHGLTLKAVADQLEFHENTVRNFLQGKPIHRSTESAFRRFMAEYSVGPGNRVSGKRAAA